LKKIGIQLRKGEIGVFEELNMVQYYANCLVNLVEKSRTFVVLVSNGGEVAS